MRILTVANVIPMRDRSAGWFRFAQILKILAATHEVHLHPVELRWQLEKYGGDNVLGYRSELEALGVRITSGEWGDMARLLRAAPIEIAFFEHYTSARDLVERVRLWQPAATVVVDSIDISYRRLMSKAAITGKDDDHRVAREVRAAELAVYARADVVIAISSLDKALLAADVRDVWYEVIPLIYPTRPLPEFDASAPRSVVFIADFEHDANVDGIVHFCRAVLPRIVKEIPDVRVRIVGPSPPPAVAQLAGPHVEVLGFLPDIASAYASGTVAIAPMRYGGGLKGKIAEALSYGVPVVTSSFCLEGFGLSDGIGVLVGDDPETFANAVVRLLREPELYRRLSETGWDFIRNHYSEDVVADSVRRLVSRREDIPKKRLALHRRAWQSGRRFLHRHLAWRLRRRGAIRSPK